MCHLLSFVLVPSEKGLQIYTEDAMSRHWVICQEQNLTPEDIYYEREWPTGKSFPEVRVDPRVHASKKDKLENFVFNYANRSRVGLFKKLANQIGDPIELVHHSSIGSDLDLIKVYVNIFGVNSALVEASLDLQGDDWEQEIRQILEKKGWNPLEDAINWLEKYVYSGNPGLLNYGYSQEDIDEALNTAIRVQAAYQFDHIVKHFDVSEDHLYKFISPALDNTNSRVLLSLLRKTDIRYWGYAQIAKALQIGLNIDPELVDLIYEKMDKASRDERYRFARSAINLAINEHSSTVTRSILGFAKTKTMHYLVSNDMKNILHYRLDKLNFIAEKIDEYEQEV